MAVTLRFQSSGVVPGRGEPVRMRGRSLTVGRGSENDMVLPDPDRLISGRHCVIEDHGGRIVVMDLSTNGTFLNYGKVPLGKVATTLNDGDVLGLGNYELVVGISDLDLPDPIDVPPLPADFDLLPPVGEERVAPVVTRPLTLDDPLADDAGGGGDFLDDLLGGGGPAGHSGIKRPDLADDGLLPPLGLEDDPLLAPARDPFAGGGASRSDHGQAMQDAFQPARVSHAIPDDWDAHFDDLMPAGTPAPMTPAAPAPRSTNPFVEIDSLPAPAAAPVVPMVPPPGAEPSVAPVLAPAPVPVAPPVAAAAAVPARPAVSDAAARAFLNALGAGEVPVGDADLVATMTRLGTAMSVMVQGLREVLMTRTAIKSEFRIAQTMIAAGGNNPLKFSVSPEQAIEAMVRPSARGYLDAARAATQALDDIKAHEMAMMTGMEAAMKGILARLDPQVLEGRIETSGGLGSLLKGRKARYWEVYEKMYAEISNQAENDFHELFSKEFARAYQRQLDSMKRPDAQADGKPEGADDVLG